MWTAIIDVLSKTFTCLNLKVIKMPQTVANSIYAITNKIIYDCECLCLLDSAYRHFQQYFSYMVASVLLVEETGGPGGNHGSVASH